MDATASRADTRSRIIDAAARLLQQEGPAVVTTRRVAQAAGVQAPALYRLFGDKDGLLEAVAEHVMSTYVSVKAQLAQAASAADADPLGDLRAGWQSQIDFGLANPALFRLLSDPARGLRSPAAQAGQRVLRARVGRLAAARRLRVSEQRAAGLIQAAGIGAIGTLLSTPAGQRDPGLADAMFEAVLREILADAPGRPENGPLAAAVAVRAVTAELGMLSSPERQLLAEWLDRAIAALQDS